ncbi:MAG: 1-acyl-sn-glycerol-3-phosphate acyltransferase [Anaerolineaceae bacterium]|nr:MAG: 1-acyl-sn-glycerol-3-phosphate acyltransferase [Anaerolineaceae bacterium]
MAEKLHPFRRRPVRFVLKQLSIPAFALLTRLEINGAENLPDKGPLLLVGNHFSFIDPVAFVRFAPWPIEFVGGAVTPHAPLWTRIIPFLWGYHKLYRGTGSRAALQAAENILKNDGILGIFPEAGNWATILRPARPGTAYLAARTGAPILPVGLDGFTEVFPSLFRGRRARVTVNIGKPFGPFTASGSGRERRAQLDEIGHEIMRHIAPLLPPEKRGHYSDDPAIREAAKGTEIYPWADKVEGEVVGEIH